MAKSSKPRKKYKPRPTAIPVTIRHDAEGDTDLQLIPHLSLENLRQGRPDASDWHTLTARLNLGMVLANFAHKEAVESMLASLNAMLAIARRHDSMGKWGGSGDEYAAIGEGLRLTDDMQMLATRRELKAALEIVFREGAIA